MTPARRSRSPRRLAHGAAALALALLAQPALHALTSHEHLAARADSGWQGWADATADPTPACAACQAGGKVRSVLLRGAGVARDDRGSASIAAPGSAPVANRLLAGPEHPRAPPPLS